MHDSLWFRCDWCTYEFEKLYVVEIGDYKFVVCGSRCHWDLGVALNPEPLTVEEFGAIMEDVA